MIVSKELNNQFVYSDRSLAHVFTDPESYSIHSKVTDIRRHLYPTFFTINFPSERTSAWQIAKPASEDTNADSSQSLCSEVIAIRIMHCNCCSRLIIFPGTD